MLGPVSDELMRLLLNFEAFTVPDDSGASEEAVTVDRGLHTQFHPDRPLNNYAVRIENNPRAFVSNSDPSYRLTSSDMSIGINSKISVDCLLEDFKESPALSQKSTTYDIYKTSDGKTSPVIEDPLPELHWDDEFLSDLGKVDKIIEKQLGVDDSQKVQQVSSVKYDRWPLLTPGENTSESSTAKKMRYMSTELPAEMEVIEGSDERVISRINHDHSYASVSATDSSAAKAKLKLKNILVIAEQCSLHLFDPVVKKAKQCKTKCSVINTNDISNTLSSYQHIADMSHKSFKDMFAKEGDKELYLLAKNIRRKLKRKSYQKNFKVRNREKNKKLKNEVDKLRAEKEGLESENEKISKEIEDLNKQHDTLSTYISNLSNDYSGKK